MGRTPCTHFLTARPSTRPPFTRPVLIPAAPAPDQGPRRRALIAHSDDTVSQRLAEALSQRGWAVVIARHGTRALEILHYATPDLVIVESTLPGSDGDTLLRLLRRERRLVGSTLIAVSAEATQVAKADYDLIRRRTGQPCFIVAFPEGP